MNKPARTKEEVVGRLRASARELSALGVAEIGLFGSFAEGRQTAASDVDLLVDFEPARHTFDNFMELSFLLESLLGRPIEIVTREALSPHIGPHILSRVERVPLGALVRPPHSGRNRVRPVSTSGPGF